MRVARGVMKKQGLVTAVFHSKDAASRAFDDLINRGYHARDIVLIMSQDTYRSHFLARTARSKDIHEDPQDSIRTYAQEGGLRELPGTGLVASGPFVSDQTLQPKNE